MAATGRERAEKNKRKTATASKTDFFTREIAFETPRNNADRSHKHKHYIMLSKFDGRNNTFEVMFLTIARLFLNHIIYGL